MIAPQPEPRRSSGSSSKSSQTSSSTGHESSAGYGYSGGSGGKGGPGPWAKLFLGALLAGVGGYLAFTLVTPNPLQIGVAAGLFGVGLATLAMGLLPGRLSFRRAGIVATGGIALFLILWFALRGGLIGGGGDPSSSTGSVPALHERARMLAGSSSSAGEVPRSTAQRVVGPDETSHRSSPVIGYVRPISQVRVCVRLHTDCPRSVSPRWRSI
jgi:hypothetical protein